MIPDEICRKTVPQLEEEYLESAQLTMEAWKRVLDRKNLISGTEIFWKFKGVPSLSFQILASIKKGPLLFKPFSKARWNVSAVSAIAASTPIPFAI